MEQNEKDGDEDSTEIIHLDQSEIVAASTITDELLLLAIRTEELNKHMKECNLEFDYEMRSISKNFRSIAGQTLTIKMH